MHFGKSAFKVSKSWGVLEETRNRAHFFWGELPFFLPLSRLYEPLRSQKVPSPPACWRKLFWILEDICGQILHYIIANSLLVAIYTFSWIFLLFIWMGKFYAQQPKTRWSFGFFFGSGNKGTKLFCTYHMLLRHT